MGPCKPAEDQQRQVQGPLPRSSTWAKAVFSVNKDWGMNGLRVSLPRKTWGYWWMKSWIWLISAHSFPTKPALLWTSKQVWPVDQRMWFSPSTPALLDFTFSTISNSEASNTAKNWYVTVGPEVGHEEDHFSYEEGLWEQGLFTRQSSQETLYCGLSILTEILCERWTEIFLPLMES